MGGKGNRRLVYDKQAATSATPCAKSVVGKAEIARRLLVEPDNPEALLITPLPYPEDYECDSVDLRLGQHFFVPRGHRTPHFCPGITPPEQLYQRTYIQIGHYLVVPAHSTVLGATLEFIKLPSDMAGQILTKSSWARTFITIEGAPWVHPLYRGCLTLEIANTSNTPIILHPGVRIAQLVLIYAETEYEKDCISGSYPGPVRPEPAKITDPRKALRRLGLRSKDVIVPTSGYCD